MAQETTGAFSPDQPIEVQKELFDKVFAKIDTDNSGRIVKLEMAHFIKKFIP